MLHKTDFFQEQTAQCRALAARAANKTDREFWLRLAQRWEELLRAKQLESEGSAAEPVQKLVSGRTRFTRRCIAGKGEPPSPGPPMVKGSGMLRGFGRRHS